jgi:hypothetical protein
MWAPMAEARGASGERRMGTILAFRRNEDAAIPETKPIGGSLGEIIIFPGVRIERGVWKEKPADTSAPSRKRAQRGRKK